MLTDAAVRQKLEQLTKQSSVTAVARDLDISQPLLTMVIRGDRDLSEALLTKLGIRRVVRYTRQRNALV
jgi:plasmid maintenance system antidote protein VapI